MRALIAILLLLFATAVGALEILALIDPVGAKMADDGDPFGDPARSWVSHPASAAMIVAPVTGAVLLLRGRKKGLIVLR
ncbi:hypothetical protein GCM10009422_01730 [Brevundimonas kwangchunensis]|uniref:Uncharacterized protein n=1 Tax=Brevundimonas kwangchunensis TaxID=322163 RepID=A0ABN1GFQ4_9CAUL